VWSCGVVLHTMLAGSYPFQDSEQLGSIPHTVQVRADSEATCQGRDAHGM